MCLPFIMAKVEGKVKGQRIEHVIKDHHFYPRIYLVWVHGTLLHKKEQSEFK